MDNHNELSDLIDDETFDKLNAEKLFDETAVRNHAIRKIFKEKRNEKMCVEDAIQWIQVSYGHLQFDTIRKIVYKIR